MGLPSKHQNQPPQDKRFLGVILFYPFVHLLKLSLDLKKVKVLSLQKGFPTSAHNLSGIAVVLDLAMAME